MAQTTMNRIRLVFAVVVCTLTTSCGPAPDGSQDDAVATLAAGDCRFMHIRSHFFVAPGIPRDAPGRSVGDRIEYTGPFVMDRATDQEERANAAAMAYVRKYNQHIAAHRSSATCRLPERRAD